MYSTFMFHLVIYGELQKVDTFTKVQWFVLYDLRCRLKNSCEWNTGKPILGKMIMKTQFFRAKSFYITTLLCLQGLDFLRNNTSSAIASEGIICDKIQGIVFQLLRKSLYQNYIFLGLTYQPPKAYHQDNKLVLSPNCSIFFTIICTWPDQNVYKIKIESNY